MVTEPATFSPEVKFVASDGVAATPLGDRLALLNLAASTYYTMNPVAAAIWGRLESPQSPAELAGFVRDTFETGSADVDADVAKLLSELLNLKLVRHADA